MYAEARPTTFIEYSIWDDSRMRACSVCGIGESREHRDNLHESRRAWAGSGEWQHKRPQDPIYK